MNRILGVVVIFVLLCRPRPGECKIIVVNSTNNAALGPGETNLVSAINSLQDGDSIHFQIAGSGPFYLITPPMNPDNGYPAITNNNVTIDGYSQPGAFPNSNPILGSNNAQLKIVIDSRASGRHVEDIPGYSTGESAALLIKDATNVTIRGLCFLGPGPGQGTDADPSTYAISFALGADFGHVQGCWVGVDLDRTNVFGFRDAVTAFEGPSGRYINNTIIGVEKTAPNSAVARSEFNVVVGEYAPIILEGENYRISGNFFNVFPDGLRDFNINGIPPNNLEAFIEFGRRGSNLVLGTDGDGINDADERNLFGGITAAGDGEILEWYGARATNIVIAGNYFGIASDGITRFTNSMKVIGGLPDNAILRLGSDFDGISDAIEGNFFAMNYPFDELFPSPGIPGPPRFCEWTPGDLVSLRGNRMLGNNLAPFSYAQGNGGRLSIFTNYCAPFIGTSSIIPVLSANSTQNRLRGSCSPGLAPYTNIIIDLYLADEEGWTNGQKFQLAELMYTDEPTGNTAYYGFSQGKTYLASFTDNGPFDLNPATGQFEFDVSGVAIAGEKVVVAASYSADGPGTHNGRTHTSNFSLPIVLPGVPKLAVARAGTNLLLSWPTNTGVYNVQGSIDLADPSWMNLTPQPLITRVGSNFQASVMMSTNKTFYRLAR